ncbi:hypothetical protein ACWIG5_40895, partial [Streptomyces lydicus]
MAESNFLGTEVWSYFRSLPIIDLGNDSIDRMRHVLMPDPEYVEFGAAVESTYRELPATFGSFYTSCGRGGAEPPEQPFPPPTVNGSRVEFREYSEAAAALVERYKEFRDVHIQLRDLIDTVQERVEDCKTKINEEIIGRINSAAPTQPADGVSMDDHILKYITSALQNGEVVMQRKVAELKGLADRVRTETERIEPPAPVTPPSAPITPPPAPITQPANPPPETDGPGSNRSPHPSGPRTDSSSPEVPGAASPGRQQVGNDQHPGPSTPLGNDKPPVATVECEAQRPAHSERADAPPS